MNFDGAEIARATGGRLLTHAPAGPVATDTRALPPKSWFLALAGERFDGHRFLDQAREAGAVGCIVAEPPGAGWQGGQVRVADTTRALADLGRSARERLAGPVIGLTGSAGKTTTRALVAQALAQMGTVHQTQGNLNNHLGVPMTLLAAPESAAASVIEMGTSGPGEIGLLAEIARPNVRLVVNVGPAHLEELGGLEGVAAEKAQLFDTARPHDLVVRNADDPFVRAMVVPAGVREIRYGRAEEASIRLVAAHIERQTLSTHARFETPAGTLQARIPAPGLHLAHNAAAALAVAAALDLDLARAARDLEGYEPVGMRLRPEPLLQGATALNDSYNANPISTEAALRLLAELPGRRVAVLGDMLELGPSEADWHDRMARLAGSLDLDLVVLLGPRMAQAASACTARDVWPSPDLAGVADRLRAWLRDGDVVLVKGSRGARLERLLQQLRDEPARGGRG